MTEQDGLDYADFVEVVQDFLGVLPHLMFALIHIFADFCDWPSRAWVEIVCGYCKLVSHLEL